MDKFELPGYEVLDRVGVGGMATVWMARQLSLDRIVAIKVLSTTNIKDRGLIDRFRQEAQAAAKLNHPAIIQVYDAGEHQGLVYYVMEYVAGFTVGELLRRKGVLEAKHAYLIGEGVAHAMNYAWVVARMIHCDIKPDNIMIDRDGTVKVADLGLARVIGMAKKAPEDDLIIGTPNYISPEQSEGDKTLDCRTDIYSLGAMLYHMTTGTLPFGYCRGTEAMDKHISSYLPDPAEVNQSIPIGLAWLIEKMMVKDRNKRHASWAEFLQDLEEVVAGGAPLKNIPEAGASTVIRSDRRAHTPLPERKKRATSTAPSPEEAHKKKIVLTREMQDALRSSSDSKRPNLQESLFSMLLLLIVVGAAYCVFFFIKQMPKEKMERATAEPQQSLQEVLPPRSKAYAVDAEKEEVLRIAEHRAGRVQEPPKKEERQPKQINVTEDGTVTWNNPDFLQGADLFNEALQLYEDYLSNKAEPAVLGQIEKNCRLSIDAFESCRSLAPDDIDIDRYVNDAYRMIADCRQFTLLEFSQDLPKDSGAETPKNAVTEKATPPAVVPTKPKGAPDIVGLSLSSSWNAPTKGGEQIYNDLYTLLSQYGEPGVDLSAMAGTRLYQGIRYLMPAEDAAKALGSRLGEGRRLNCPGFPKNSFNYFEINGQFGSGFNKMLLVADTADRVVAVQLVNDRPPNEVWLEPADFKSDWEAYNFIEVHRKAKKDWMIAHRIEELGDVYKIDSELATYSQYGPFGVGQSKERVSLYLPKPVINLLLFRIQELRTLNS